MLELRRLLEEIYSRHTGQTLEQVHDDMERDRFFSAEQAVDYGLVDEIISARELSRAQVGLRGRVAALPGALGLPCAPSRRDCS